LSVELLVTKVEYVLGRYPRNHTPLLNDPIRRAHAGRVKS
jgi:hypothetical protein